MNARHGFAVLLTAALALAGCAAPSAGPPVARTAPTHSVVTIAPQPSASARVPVVLGRGSVRQPWENARLTAEFCGVTEVRFTDGVGRAASTLYSEVDLYLGRVTYGNLDPFGDAAAIQLHCNNTGGTAAGDLAAAYVIVVVRDGELLSLAEIVPQADVGDRPGYFAGIAFRGRTVVAFEHWFRSEDSTCCPSGRAETIWTPSGGTFVPQAPHLS